MTTTWTIAIDWNRNGSFSDTYDNVTQYVIDANWFLGMRQPYQSTADNAKLTLVLDNADKRFSPENEDGPLWDSALDLPNAVPYRPVKITSDDGVTERVMWQGWIESIQPDVGKYGQRRVRITAAGPMQFFKAAETALQIQENRRTDQIVDALLDEVDIPTVLNGAWILGLASFAELGQKTYLAHTIIDRALDAGLTTLAYAADNWVQRDAPAGQDTFNVYRALSDAAAAERGRFLFDREGKALFWNRHHLLASQTVQASFSDTMTGLGYNYAGPEEFHNEVVVTCHPRTISAGSNELLWSLEKAVTIKAGEKRSIHASYHDDSDNRIGGKNVTLANVTFSTGDADVSLDASANRAGIEIDNTGSEDAVLETCEIRGQKITDFGRMDAVQYDQLSITRYGRRTLSMQLPSVDDFDQAEQIALFEVNRRKDPRGRVHSMELTSHGENGGNSHAYQLARTLGDRISITESQTAHTGDYHIIGEAHRLAEAGTLFETTWYLEAVTDSNWFILGQAHLDASLLAI